MDITEAIRLTEGFITSMEKTLALHTKFQNKEISYDSFMVGAIKIHKEMPSEFISVDGTFSFLENNRDNDLPNMSSGSLRTALLDLDGLFWIFDDETEELQEEINEYATNLWNSLK